MQEFGSSTDLAARSHGIAEPDDVAEVRRLARDFVHDVLEPAEAVLDRIADPAEVFESPVFVKAMEAAFDLGMTRASMPREWGGPGWSTFAQLVLAEELAAGAPGLGSHILTAGISASLIISTKAWKREPVYEAYLRDRSSIECATRGGAWAATEPTVGSDILSLNTPNVSYRVVATPTDDGYSLSGEKSALVGNAYCADMLVVMANIPDTSDMSGSVALLVPKDLPGVTVSRPTDKLGLRALNQSTIRFDDVRVPKAALAFGPGDSVKRYVVNMTSRGNTAVGLQSIGVAQRAFEVALAHVREREQGGSKLFDHQLVAHSLFSAYREIHAARAFSYRAVRLLEDRRLDPLVCYASRVQASTMAVRVVEQLVQLMGGAGIVKDNPIERYYRDVKLLTIADGPVDKVALVAAQYL